MKPPDTEPAPADPNQHLVPGPARAVQLIAQKAVLGFRSDAGVLRAGYTTHDVAVQDGIIEMVPYHAAAAGRVTGGKLGVETGAILREDGTAVGGGSQPRVNSDGAVEIARGAAVEVVTNREDGVEQEWRFSTAPPGDGDLTVEVQLTGHEFIGQTASGLHFQSSAGLGFRYSNAVWIDAGGHEWPIPVAWNDGRISITVPGDIVAMSTFPAVLDPTISAEVAIDTQVNGWTGQTSQTPAIAFDGTNYLVVWSDQRLSRDEDIFATRVSQAGAILDTNGIAISTAAGRQLHPTVVFAGSQYLVAWEDFKISGGAEADIGAARVSTAGVVTQLGRVASSTQNETQPHIAANGATALMVWTNGSDIRGSLWNGTAFGGAISITSDATAQTDPAVASRPGGNYLVVYSEGATTTADLRGQLVTAAGVKSGAAFNVSAGAGRQYAPAAAFDGTNYVVVWTNNNSGVNLFGTRVSTASVVLDTRTEGATINVGGVSISSVPNSNQEVEALSCASTTCLVVWQDNRNLATTGTDVFGQLFTTSGALTLSGSEFTVSNVVKGQSAPALATTGSGFFTVWEDARDSTVHTVFGTSITTAGAVGSASGTMLVTGNNRETTPALGLVGTTTALLWADSRNFGSDIELVRFAGTTRLDATVRPVSTATFAQASPAVTIASTGTFFAVWNDSRNGIDRDIYGARFDTAGNILDPGGRAISTATNDQLVPAIATNGAVSLVVWQDRRSGTFDIYGALVDNATGSVTLNDIAICTQAGDQGRPAVSYDATTSQFLVVWGDNRVVTDPNIFGARVTVTGTVLDVDGVSISSAASGQFSPRVSFIAGKALVVWEDRRDDDNGDIFGARVSIGTAITVIDPAGFSISGGAAGEQFSPAVGAIRTAVASQASWLVAWTDGRDVNTSGTDIFGQQVSQTASISGAPFAISANPEDEDSPALADSTTETTRIAYTRVRTDLSTIRLETRTIGSSTSNGQACSTDAQCSSGFCVDTRCCDSACGGTDKTDCQACARAYTGQPDGTCSLIPGPNITICRNYASTFCDLREYCDGVNPACPPDVGRREGLVCNSTTGAVCPANAAPGPHGCP